MSSSYSSKASKPALSSKTASSSSSSRFTDVMRDRQARNKDPATGLSYGSPPDNEESASTAPGRSQGRSSKKPSRIAYAEDAYESLERRRWAATILDNSELLIMHALSRGDSLPGTKHHFIKILCGYDDSPRSAEKKATARRESSMPIAEKVYKPFTGAFEM